MGEIWAVVCSEVLLTGELKLSILYICLYIDISISTYLSIYIHLYIYIYIYIYIYNIYIYIYIINIIYIDNCLCGSVAKASDTSSRTWVRSSSGPLINFIKWVLKYYLEVILYNCV